VHASTDGIAQARRAPHSRPNRDREGGRPDRAIDHGHDPDGRTITRKIENRKNLEGVKAGDRTDITGSQAVVIAAEPAK